MRSRFRWDSWNLNHISEHRVKPSEAQYVVEQARAPFPKAAGNEKWLVWGQTLEGRFLQVIYVFDSDEDYDYESMTWQDMLELSADNAPRKYIIHARDLTAREKSRYRRKK